MSINQKSAQKGEIERKKVKSGAKKSKIECKTVKIKKNMIDNSYFELEETEWRTKILKMKIETLSKFQYNYLITKQSAKLNNNY